MWSLLSVAAALFAAAASAVSTGGSRLLVVLDDVAEKDTYGQFLGDLTGMFGPSFFFWRGAIGWRDRAGAWIGIGLGDLKLEN